MSDTADESLLEAILDSWDRNHTIMLNLLRALPEGGLEARAMEGSPSASEQFTHIHYERLVSVFEEAPEFARNVPEEEWMVERKEKRIAQMLEGSAKAVRGRVLAGRDMDLNYNHPILILEYQDWARGLPSRPDQAGPQTGGPPDQ